MSEVILSFLANGLLNASWVTLLIYFLVVTQLTIFSVTLYLHRSQAHRGVDFHPLLAHFFRFWTWFTTAMVTRDWIAIHRKHHARCETAEDPHSPQVHGINKVLFHGVVLYQESRKDASIMEKYGHGAPNDWIERRVYARWPALGPSLLLLLNLSLFGAIGITLWAVQMLWIPVMAAGVVNGLGHWWGYRNFETADCATNLTPWGVFIGGEELHNNHHAFPASAKFALRRFEFDIGWQAIKLLRFFGLARVLRVAPSLNVRPNVSLPDTETVKAVMAHRFQLMTDYFRGVVVPTLREEAAKAGANLRQMLPRRLRKAIANDGRWLDFDARETLSRWIAERPTLATVVEYRKRLDALLARGSLGSEAMVKALQDWCREAEATGNRALAEFSKRLKGYALVPMAG